MFDLPSPRIEGIPKRERESDPPERSVPDGKRKPQPVHKPRFPEEQQVEIEAQEKHDLDELA